MTPKEMRELAGRIKNNHPYFLNINSVADALEQGAAAMEWEEWIPVGERLPNKFETVLVADVDDWWGTGCFDGALWYGDNFGIDGDSGIIEATHWRPLPLPPASDSMAQKDGAVRGGGGG